MPAASSKGKATAAAVAAFSIFHDGIGTSSLPSFSPQDASASVTPSTNTNHGRSLTRALTFSPPSRTSPQPPQEVFDIFSSFTGEIPHASKGKSVAATPLPNNEKENCNPTTGEATAGAIPDKKSKVNKALALSGSNRKALGSKAPSLKRSNTSPATLAPAGGPSPSSNVFGTLRGNSKSGSSSRNHNSNATTSASGSGSQPRTSKPKRTPTALDIVPEEGKRESLEATVTGRIILTRMIVAESEADRRARELTEVVLGDLSQAYDASETAPLTPTEGPTTVLIAAELTARLKALLHGPSGQELPTVVRQRALPCGIKRAYDETDESEDVTDCSQAFTSVASSQAFSPAPEARKVKKLKTAKFGVDMSSAVTKLGAIDEVEPVPPVPHTTPVKDEGVERQIVEEAVNASPVSLRRSRRLGASRQGQVELSEGPVAATSRAFGLPPPPPFLIVTPTGLDACDEGDVFGCL